MTMSDTEEEQTPGIFDGLTAWFSSSVNREIIEKWKSEDGDLVDIDVAMLVFSEDAEALDTKKLYNSTAYLNENLAIFHASYIGECIKCGKTKSVSIGKYLLPPVALYQKIKNFVQYNYTYTTGHDSSSSHTTDSDENNRTQVKKRAATSKTSLAQYSEYVDVNCLPIVKGPLMDFEVGKNGCHVVKK